MNRVCFTTSCFTKSCGGFASWSQQNIRFIIMFKHQNNGLLHRTFTSASITTKHTDVFIANQLQEINLFFCAIKSINRREIVPIHRRVAVIFGCIDTGHDCVANIGFVVISFLEATITSIGVIVNVLTCLDNIVKMFGGFRYKFCGHFFHQIRFNSCIATIFHFLKDFKTAKFTAFIRINKFGLL